MKLKKILLCTLSISLLASCTNKSKDEPQKPQKLEENQDQKQGDKADKKDENIPEKSKSEIESDDILNYIGKTYDKDGVSIDLLKGGKINKSFEQGPLKISIEGMYIGRITKITNEQIKSYYNTDDPINIVTIIYKVENTSNDTYEFYIGQSPITTDSKEQIEADLLVGKEGGGNLLGQTIKDGINVYYPNNKIEDIKEITWHIKDANSEDYQTKIDGIKVKFTFDEKGNIKSTEEIK